MLLVLLVQVLRLCVNHVYVQGPYGTVKYNILEQGVPGLFSIDENSGQFRLAQGISTQTGTVFYVSLNFALIFSYSYFSLLYTSGRAHYPRART